MAESVRIERFTPERAADFRRLNLEWIERFFEVEPVDAAILDNPVGQIIEAGGEIFFDVDGDEAIGTCAVKPTEPDKIELSKMAVTPKAQGRGVGRQLLHAAIDWYQSHDGSDTFFLESHHALKPALALYRKVGFQDAARGDCSDYERCDVYMEWRATAVSSESA